jgi:hypothetical protein
MRPASHMPLAAKMTAPPVTRSIALLSLAVSVNRMFGLVSSDGRVSSSSSSRA